ncbi:DNA-directed RNA polymerase subunit K [Candidatus Woesearchaeota archaeon]|nr:DNA-directed RNA polymerase subunit K [Candidatus Woesearchaeota archaeon]
MAKKKETGDEPERYTKYEKARMLGSRALQVSMGAPYLVKISKKDLEAMKYNPLEIAKKEFEAGVIPITVVRPLPKVETEEQEAK